MKSILLGLAFLAGFLLSVFFAPSAGASHDTINPEGTDSRYSYPDGSRPYLNWMTTVEDRLSLPHFLLVEVARQESGYSPAVIKCQRKSKMGAEGIMQIIPKWHPAAKPCDPEAAIAYSGVYLKYLHKTLGSWVDALVAYHWGIGRVQRCKANPQCDYPMISYKYAYTILFNIGMTVT